MERRLYFLIGDIVSNAGAGALVATGVAAFIDPTWLPVVAMVVGMLAGGIGSIPVAMVGSFAFGAFEVMVPVMTTGMLSGMVVGMAAAMGQLDRGAAAVLGAGTGLVVLALLYAFDARIRRKGVAWTS